MKSSYDPANSLQTLLVHEFRTCQRVLQLLQEEQRALLHGDTQQLLNQAGVVVAALENLEQIQTIRLSLANSRGQKFPRSSECCPPGLQAGVHVLRGKIFAILRSNTALACKALEQTQAMQSRLDWPAEKTDFPAVFAAILDARQALEAGDRHAIANALDNLQALIVPSRDHTQLVHEETRIIELVNVLQPAKANGLMEKIAAIHRQQNAYRAVFQSGQRMLSLGN